VLADAATSASEVRARTGEDAIVVPGAATHTTFAHKRATSATSTNSTKSASTSSASTPSSTSNSSTQSTESNTPTTNGVETVYVSVASVTPTTSDDTNTSTSEANIKTLIAGLNTYWAAQSEGAVSVVFGGYETRSIGASSCDSTSVLSSEETKAFGGKFANDAWIGTHDHLLVLTKESCSNQSFATVGGDGGEIFSGNGATGIGQTYLLHEFGHNLGFQHADASVCTNTTTGDDTIANFGFTSTTCPTTEYDDYLDIMGYTVSGATPNLSSPQQILAGWLTAFATATSATGAQTVTLSPLGGTTGTRALKIEDPTSGDVYYVEYRADSGRDGTSADFAHAQQCGSAHNSYKICNLGGTSAGEVRILRELPFSGQNASGTTVEAVGAVSGSATSRVTHLATGQTFENYDDGFSLKLNSVTASKSASVTVSFVTSATTNTAIAINPGSQTYATSNPATAVVTVSSPKAGTTLSGTVDFYDGSTKIGSSAVDADGTASLGLSRSLAVGTHGITARFAPDSADTAASKSHAAAIKVNKVASSVAFSLSTTSPHRTTIDKATVTVKAAGISGPSGTLTVYKNGVKWKSYTLSSKSGGHLTISLPKFSHTGTKTVTMSYSGNSGIASSKSAKHVVKVTK
jgi:hypothetical protein